MIKIADIEYEVSDFSFFKDPLVDLTSLLRVTRAMNEEIINRLNIANEE